MVMFEQQRRLSEPLRWGRRERTAIAAFAAIVVVALIGLGVFALSSGSPARADCVDVSFPGTLGGSELKGCGERARAIDAQVGADQLRQWAARWRMTHGRHQSAERATGNSPCGQLELIEESQGSRLLAELLSACKAYSRAPRDPRKR